MNIKIRRDIIDEIESPILLAAWSGMGNVGLGAVGYIRRELEAVPFAEVEMSEYFIPEAIVVEEGIVKFPDLPSHIFYYVRDPGLIIFESEAQVAGSGGIALINQILDLAEQLKVETIYTGAAFAMPISYRKPVQVWSVANQEVLRDVLAPHGVEIMQEGHISGLNGLLLGFAGVREIEAACLLATMPQYAIQMPNPKASREIVRVLERLVGIQVDMSEIDKAVERMDCMMADVEEKIRMTFSSMEREEGEEEELEEMDEEQVPQHVMEKIEQLFQEVQVEGSKEKATRLKKELDKWNLYSFYEDRFLNLFRQDQEGNL